MESENPKTLNNASCKVPALFRASDTPKTWYLTHYSEEVVGIIAGHAGLVGVTRLLNCGSRVLTLKLSSQRCIIDLWFNADWGHLKALPSQLSSLKGLVGMSFIGVPKTPSTLDWSIFPRTLHYFRNDAMTTDDLWRFHDQISDFSDLTTFSFSWVKSRLPSHNSTMLDILANLLLKMPKLRVLRTGPNLPADGVSYIPSTVLELEYGTASLNISQPVLSALTKLVLMETTSITVPACMAQFPYLESLYIPKATLNYDQGLDTENLKPVEITFFKSFPSLTELNLSSFLLRIICNRIGTPDAPMSLFWENLKNLSVAGMVKKRFPLPSSLISLSANLGKLTTPGLLPRSLRYLELPHTLVTTFDNFPPSLVKLSANFELIKVERKIDLPNLTHLKLLNGQRSRSFGCFERLHMLPDSLILLELDHQSCLWKVVRTPRHLCKPETPSKWITYFSACESGCSDYMDYLRLWGQLPSYSQALDAAITVDQYSLPPKIVAIVLSLVSDDAADFDLSPTLMRSDRLKIYKAMLERKCSLLFFGTKFLTTVIQRKIQDVLEYLLSEKVCEFMAIWDLVISAEKWDQDLVGKLVALGPVSHRYYLRCLIKRLVSHGSGRSDTLVITKAIQRLYSKAPSCFSQNEFDAIFEEIIVKEKVLDGLVRVLEIVLSLFRNVLDQPLNLSEIFMSFLKRLNSEVWIRLEEPYASKELPEPFTEGTLIWFNSHVDLLLKATDAGFSAIHAAIAVKSETALWLMNFHPRFPSAASSLGDFAVHEPLTSKFETPTQFAKLWGEELIILQLTSVIQHFASPPVPDNWHSTEYFSKGPVAKIGTPNKKCLTTSFTSFAKTPQFGHGSSAPLKSPTSPSFGTSGWSYLSKNKDAGNPQDQDPS